MAKLQHTYYLHVSRSSRPGRREMVLEGGTLNSATGSGGVPLGHKSGAGARPTQTIFRCVKGLKILATRHPAVAMHPVVAMF